MKNLLLMVFLLVAGILMGQEADSVRVAREVDSLIQESRSLTGKGDFENALKVNSLAEDLSLKHFGNQSTGYGSACFNRGKTLHIKGEYKEAESWYLISKAIREKTLGIKHPDYAATLHNIAVLYYNTGEYKKSETNYLEAIKIRRQVFGDYNLDYAQSLLNLAVLYNLMGKYTEAESLYLETIKIRGKLLGKEHPDYAWSLNNLGVLYWQLSQYENAELLWKESNMIQKKTLGVENPGFATSQNNLAILYATLGNYNKAEELYLNAIDIRGKVLGKEHPDYAASLINLAVMYYEINQVEKAEILWLEAKNIQQKTLGKEHPEYASSLHNLAVLYHMAGKYNKAEELFLEALEIRKKALGKEHVLYASSLYNLANLYADLARYEEAESLYEEARIIQEKTVGKTHVDYIQNINNLAALFRRTKKFGKALELSLESKIICEKTLGNEHPKYASILYNLANLYWEIKNFKEAENTYCNLSLINRHLLQNACQYLSEKETNNYLIEFYEYQDKILSFIASTEDIKLKTTAFDNKIFYNGFLLNINHQINKLSNSGLISREKINRLKGYSRQLASLYAIPLTERDSERVFKLELKLNELEKEINRSVLEYSEVIKQVDWLEVKNKLKLREAAIEFTRFRYYNPDPTDSILYAALVLLPQDTSPHFVYLCTEAQLNGVLSRWNEKKLVESPSVVYWPRQGEASLYGLLWQPLESLLPKGTTVWYSPAGLLHRLNLDAIGISKYEALADRYTLHRIGSTRQIALPNTTEYTGKEAALFGGLRYETDTTALQKAISDLGLTYRSDEVEERQPVSPDGPRSGRDSILEYLPNSLAEVQNISKSLRASGFKASVFTDYAGTEEAFLQMGNNNGKVAQGRKKSPRILHVATHGYFFPDPKEDSTALKNSIGMERHIPYRASDNPFIRSGLLLSGSEHAWQTGTPASAKLADGILTAADIAAMDLSNTELAVLSACETGLGDIESNEGVYGLQRAFKIAGTRYLIMSLWKVSDEASMELMTAFYAKWLDKKKPMPVPEAFRAAQAELRKKYENPYHWAGFVLVQ